ncbi:MAG: hypothetical protein methR_P2726 [Methyloprofundus sp.]|nr:MAG: hypothetical protein methR_P2726 [Methyloprofundus sp.]
MKQNIAYQADVLERFIPISLDTLVIDLLDTNLLPTELHSEFQQFCNSYIALLHAHAHTQLQFLKSAYQPFNPDRDTLITDANVQGERLIRFKSVLHSVLEDANYERISEQELNEALNKISPHGVKVSVDFNDFAEVSLFYRGSAIQTSWHRSWRTFSFKKQAVNVQVFRRLFVLIQPKSKQEWVEYYTQTKKMSLAKAEKKADVALAKLGINNEDHLVYLKLFKDIPRADLEMLFPNTRVQIRLFDKLKLGVLGGGGTAGGVMAMLTKFSAAIDPMSAVIAVGGLLGVIWRQIAKIFIQRAKYSATLMKNLYFYTLDNNVGALTYLLDSAEAEECKEAILAYFFLLTEGESTRAKLDKRIETYIQQQYALPMDFEIDDGLDKLQSAELLSGSDPEINAVPLATANIKLQQQWQNVIAYKMTTNT